ncbi:TPA: hypothetical protein ACRFGJ_005090, partial [Escherichia coli]
SIPARISTGFTASQTLSGVSMAKRPEYISQLRCPAAQSDTTGQDTTLPVRQRGQSQLSPDSPYVVRR